MRERNNIIELILKTIRNYELLKRGDSVLVACSGGPDSVLLLHSLAKLKNKLGLKKIVVCNLDHGLRGKESKEDSEFVKALAGKLGLQIIQKKIKLPDGRAMKRSTEELAREARYKFFTEAARKAGVNILATGHTLDDQAETILMRIIKGSSLKGMAGISPARMQGELRIIRPLIELEKSSIVDYLDENKIVYRIDKTNLQPVYFRNITRNEIIPFLEKYNPRIKHALFNLSESLREDFQFIEDAKRGVSSFVSVKKDGTIEIRLKDLLVQPRVLQKEIIRDCLEKAGGSVKKLSFKHWKEVESILMRKGKNSAVDLPGKIRVMRTERSLVFKQI